MEDHELIRFVHPDGSVRVAARGLTQVLGDLGYSPDTQDPSDPHPPASGESSGDPSTADSGNQDPTPPGETPHRTRGR